MELSFEQTEIAPCRSKVKENMTELSDDGELLLAKIKSPDIGTVSDGIWTPRMTVSFDDKDQDRLSQGR